jgi:type IV pilus assembly protein PilB
MISNVGDILVKDGVITPEQLKKAMDSQKKEGGKLGTSLVKLGYIEEKKLVECLSKQYGIPSIDLADIEVDAEVLKFIPEDVAQKYQLVPVKRSGATLSVAMVDPTNIFAIDDLKFLTGYNIQPFVVSESALKETIDRFYDSSATLADVMSGMDDTDLEFIEDDIDDDLQDLKKSTEDAPVVKLVNLILSDAIRKGASDIHVEPYEKYLRVRLRVDGVLQEVMKPPLRLKNALTSRLKIMSQLDIAERRLPQDGRIKLKIGKDKDIDIRMSVLPTLYGEKVVLRILDKGNLQLDMTKLGFEKDALKDFMDAIHQPWGMVLVTGPTGSGKTTTLYSALSDLNKMSENISTAEDPVEYNLAGVNQVQMHDEIGLNFAASLRSFLRQDPDIIMVGEIRDYETAEISVKAALTGHLVLSTLHTNDAPSTINRLLNMGVEPFLIASSTNLVLAQRLARQICSDCKEESDIPEQALLDIGANPEIVSSIKCYKGTGCTACSDTGYKGRIALYEVMPMKEEMKDLVLNGASSAELKSEAIRLGMSTLRQSGIKKIAEGVTTIEEVTRVTMAD